MRPTGLVRLDKWLWCVRLYPSRSAATNACNAGHVKVQGSRAKPARAVRAGDTLTALVAGGVQRTVKVIGLLDRRVGAKQIANFLDDLTPPEEYGRARENRRRTDVLFPQGFGRPTKQQRRQWERAVDRGFGGA